MLVPRHALVAAGAAVAFMLAPAARASAQSPTSAPPRTGAITINPLGIPFGYFALEFERAVSAPFTLGASASYLDLGDEESYSTIELKGRYYPNELAPKGFSVGMSAGITRVTDWINDGTETLTRPTVGVVIDYNWILGKSDNFVVGTGVGAKRILGARGDFSNISFAYPTFRFQFGFAF